MVRFKPSACYMAICLSFISLQAIAAELAESSTGATQTTPIKSSSRSKFIEEVVVTAQKREETLSDVPIAITTFTGDMAKDLGITDTRDLSKLIPGFSHSDSGLSNPIYTLRGVGFNDASRTASSTVGIYYDEVSLPYSYLSKGPTLDIERIEVLKGPQGTLYGRNTTGGAINYITTKPTESLEYGLQGSYGSYQTYEVGGFYSTPLGETLGVRIAGRNIYATEGWQESVTRPGDRLGEKNKHAVRITTEWQPESTLNLRSNISLDYWRDKSEPLAPQAFLITPQGSGGELTLNPEVSSHPLADEDDAEQADWEPNTPWQLNDKFLMFATRNYLDVTENISMAIIGNYIKFKTDDAFIPQSGLDTNNSERQQTTDTQIFQLEIRADGSLYEERLDWVAGIFGSRDEVDEIQRQLISSSSATGNTVPGVHPLATSAILRGNQVSESIATFFNTDWAINSAAAISLGLRYTDEARDFSGCGQDDPEDTGVAGLASTFNTVSISRGGTGGADEGDCFTLDRNTRNPSLVEGRLAEDSVAGKLSLDWQVWEDQLLYLSLSRGFKSGSFPILGATEGEQYDPVVQEKVTAIELGAKTSWLDNRLKINVAAFDYDYVNKQLLGNFNDDVFGPLPKLFNVPKSTIQGAELEIKTEPLDGLFIAIAASYLDTEIKEFSSTTNDGRENVDFSGNKLNFAPTYEWVLLTQYSRPIFGDLNLLLGMTASYSAAAASDLENEPLSEIPAFHLLDARIGIEDSEGHWKLLLSGKNLRNEFYLLSTPQFAGDTTVRYAGMPRTASLSLSYHFF